MSLEQRESIRPDAVIQGGETTTIDQAWQELNPCPACGAVPHDAPEGVHASGDPHWVFPHCWKCGFRPGISTADPLRAQWEEFRRWQQNQTSDDFSHRSLQAPADESEVESLRQQLADAQARADAAEKVNQQQGQQQNPFGNPFQRQNPPGGS